MTPRYGHVEHVSFATSLEAMQLAVHRGEDWQAYDDSLRECARLREQDRRDPAKSLENLAMWAFEDGVDEGCASHDTNPPWSGGRVSIDACSAAMASKTSSLLTACRAKQRHTDGRLSRAYEERFQGGGSTPSHGLASHRL